MRVRVAVVSTDGVGFEKAEGAVAHRTKEKDRARNSNKEVTENILSAGAEDAYGEEAYGEDAYGEVVDT